MAPTVTPAATAAASTTIAITWEWRERPGRGSVPGPDSSARGGPSSWCTPPSGPGSSRGFVLLRQVRGASLGTVNRRSGGMVVVAPPFAAAGATAVGADGAGFGRAASAFDAAGGAGFGASGAASGAGAPDSGPGTGPGSGACSGSGAGCGSGAGPQGAAAVKGKPGPGASSSPPAMKSANEPLL